MKTTASKQLVETVLERMIVTHAAHCGSAQPHPVRNCSHTYNQLVYQPVSTALALLTAVDILHRTCTTSFVHLSTPQQKHYCHDRQGSRRPGTRRFASGPTKQSTLPTHELQSSPSDTATINTVLSDFTFAAQRCATPYAVPGPSASVAGARPSSALPRR